MRDLKVLDQKLLQMREPTGTALTIDVSSTHSMTKQERNSDNSKTPTKTQQDLQPRPSNAAAWAWYQQQVERNSDNSKTSTKTQQDLQPRPSNAAAWAWYQHAGGAAAGTARGNSATVRSASPHVAVRCASRFREEAMRRSCSGDDLVFKVDSEIVSASSLFDTYELASVARQLDRALSGNSFTTNLNSPRHRSSLKATRRLRMRVPPALCSSTKVVAIKDKTEQLEHHVKSGHRTTIHLEKLSKAFRLFSLMN